VEERRAHDRRRRMDAGDESLCVELRLAVREHGPRLGLLAVRRTLLAVEDEVGRELDEARAGACGCLGDRRTPAHDRRLHLVTALHIGRVDDGVRAMAQQRAIDGRRVADVEFERAAVRRLPAELAREHVVAALDREPADLPPEEAGGARDEKLHASSTIVTGPSFTSSTAIAAPKTPRSTCTPSVSSAVQKRS